MSSMPSDVEPRENASASPLRSPSDAPSDRPSEETAPFSSSSPPAPQGVRHAAPSPADAQHGNPPLLGRARNWLPTLTGLWQELEPTHVVVLSFLVYFVAMARFLFSASSAESTTAGVIFSLIGIIFAAIETGRIKFGQSNSEAWQIFLVIVDIGAVSGLYGATSQLKSDVFLFYALPVVGIAVNLASSRARRVMFLITCLTLPLVMAHLASNPGTSSARPLREILEVCLVREGFLCLAAIVAYQLKLALSAQSHLQNALAEIVPEAASAAILDRELDALLDDVMQLGFHCSAIGLVDESMQTISVVRARNVSPRQVEMSSYRLTETSTASEDIMLDIWRRKATEFFPSGHYDQRFNRKIYDRFGHENLARIFTPLFVMGWGERRAVGTLECGCFGADANSTVEGLKDSVQALVKKHAPRIGQRGTHFLLETVAKHAAKIIGADSASAHILRRSRWQVLYQAGIGNARIDFLTNFPPRENGFGRRAINSENVVKAGARELRADYPQLYARGIRQIAVFPLLKLGDPDLVGVLYVHFWRARKFSSREIEIERSFARQLEGALQNYLAFRHTARVAERSRQIPLLQNSIQSLASTVDPGTLLEMIAGNTLAYLPDADRVVLYEYFQSTDRFGPNPVTKERGINEPQSVVPSLDELRTTILRGEEFVDDGTGPPVARIALKPQPGEVVGVLFIRYVLGHTFDDTERLAVRSFAPAAAIAIANARLLQAEREQRDHIIRLERTIRELNGPDASQAPSAPSAVPLQAVRLEDVALAILNYLLKLFSLEHGTIWELHDDHYLTLEAASNCHAADYKRNCLPKGQGLVWRALLPGAPKIQVIHDITSADVANPAVVELYRDRSVYLIRLGDDEHTYGVACLAGRERAPAYNETLLGTVEQFLALELRSRQQELTNRLLMSGRVLLSYDDTDSLGVCDRLCKQLLDIVGCQAVTVLLKLGLDPNSTKMKVMASRVADGDRPSPEPPRSREPGIRIRARRALAREPRGPELLRHHGQHDLG